MLPSRSQALLPQMCALRVGCERSGTVISLTTAATTHLTNSGAPSPKGVCSQFLFVGKPCKRQYLCSRRSEQMVIELDSHIRLPSPFSHPLGAQSAHFPVFLDLRISSLLAVESALHMVYVSYEHLITCCAAGVSSSAGSKGKGEWH